MGILLDLALSSYGGYAIACLVILLVLALLAYHRNPVLARWAPSGSKTTTAPSQQEEKEKAIPSPSTKRSPRASYIDTFPPSNRSRLHRVLPDASAEDVDLVVLRERLIAWEADWRSCTDDTLLPSGISVGEVRALGDFPDYAALTGVPLPENYKGFVLEQARHRPYRPFRWGYFQTMALQKLEPNWWLELERSYTATVKQRLDLYAKYPDSILRSLPGTELAAKETMEMALQFYCARYPRYFSLSQDRERGWIFHNSILNTETILREHHPLHILLRNIPEDFALMVRSSGDGKYYLRAGVICSSLGWNLGTKIGLQLNAVHEAVPEYKAKLELSMDRFFATLPSHKPIQRGAWGFEVGTPLFTPPDAWDNERSVQNFSLKRAHISLRVDWQTLRRLPLSGALCFNYKAVFTPLKDLKEEPYVPSLIAKVLKEGNGDIREYKSTWHTEHITIPALGEYKNDQEGNGVIPREWQPETLEEYPFYPGWEEKWKVEQGF